jgi:hypothetical protein
MSVKVLLKDRVGHQHHPKHQHQHHKHHFRESEIAFIPSQELASRLTEGYLPTIVVDTRDDATNDGQIRGALLCPEPSFGEEQIKCLMRKANERRRVCNTGISNHKCFIVFYSRGSLKSSLTCAHRFHQAVREQGECNGISVLILRGGADAWFHSYGNNRRLCQDFDEDLWNAKYCTNKNKTHLPIRNEFAKNKA